MSSKFGFSSRYENLAKELIRHILGLTDEDDENFTASMDFVMSNLLYHHYLDVNSHTVQRSLEGVSFKMTVHGHQKKAEQLQTLIKKFLSLPVIEEKGDVKWSILSLLNELSQHPARDSLTASLTADVDESFDVSSRAETITDWLDDLMEKSFQFPDKDDTLSEWSDDDDTLRQSYCSGIESEATQHRLSKQVQLKEKKPVGEFHLKAPTTPIKEREKRNALLKAVQDSKSWFASSIQKPYWLVNKDEFHASASDNTIELTEYVVMRECIWLLLHPSNEFLFRQEGNKFIVAEPVALSTLGKGDLKAILESFAVSASKLYTIDKWLNNIETLVLKDPSSYHESLGGTLLSYADGLREWRAEHFDDVLNQLEQTIFAQEGCQTLLWLMEELRTPFSTLETIYSVHSKAFTSPNDHPLFKSLRLLSLLTQGVESGLKINDQKCVLLLFQSSIKSYLKTIHSLLWGVGPPSAAALEDFGIIKDNKEGDVTVQKYALQDLSIFSLPGLSFLNTLRGILMEVCELREIVPNLNFDEDKCSNFLELLVEDRIHSVYFQDDQKFQSKTSINNNNNNNNNNKSSNGATSTAQNDKAIKIFKQNNNNNNNNNNNKPNVECYLESVCEDLYVWETSETNSFLAKAFHLDRFEGHSQEGLLRHAFKKVFDKENFKDCKGLDYLLKNTLLPVIQNRHDFMSRYLLETLSNTYGLRRQLKVLVSAVLLDSSCAAMQEFYSNLFHRMDSKECLDEGDLTQNLQFCLGIAYPDVAPYFNIVFPQRVKSKRSSASSSTEEVLSSLSLDFSDLWPLCIVLKRSHVIKYTKIFQFCLMLRRASFTIERLHFKEIGSHFDFGDEERSFTSSFNSLDGLSDGCESKDNTLPLAHRIHRLQLLRQWVLYFSRVLRDHFSSAVFVPFSSKIEELLDKSNFSDFKQEHEVLLSKTFHECLLDEETLSPIQTTLMQLFLTVERIHELWVGPPNGIREAELDLLEEKYSSCHRLVANFLSALASVKFCPLVDGLAQCLTYNCPT